MLSPAHINANRYQSFYRLWAAAPELVTDREFDDIQLHLLQCDECEVMARRCEGQSLLREMPSRYEGANEPWRIEAAAGRYQ